MFEKLKSIDTSPKTNGLIYGLINNLLSTKKVLDGRKNVKQTNKARKFSKKKKIWNN